MSTNDLVLNELEQERFIVKIYFLAQSMGPKKCWPWPEGRGTDNYGRFALSQGVRRFRQQVQAHRASFALHYGKVPEDLDVLHKCDNPPCVNWYHLFLGTDLTNSQDKINKGRWRGHAEISYETACKIKILYRQLQSQNKVAILVGLSQRSIQNVLRRWEEGVYV